MTNTEWDTLPGPVKTFMTARFTLEGGLISRVVIEP